MRTDDGQAQGLAAPAIQAHVRDQDRRGRRRRGRRAQMARRSSPSTRSCRRTANEQMVSATETALLNSLRGELLGAYEAALRQHLLGDGEPGDAGAAHGAEGAMTGTRAG